MVSAIIAADVMGLLICGLILFGSIFESKQKNIKRKLFNLLIIAIIVAMSAECISWILENKPDATVLLNLTTMLSTTMTFAVTVIYLGYLYYYIKEKYDISPKMFYGPLIYSIVAMILTGIASVTGMIYTFESGHYVEQQYYIIYLIANVVSLVYMLIVIIMTAKHLGRRDSIVAIMFMVIPMISIAINVIVPNFSMTYPALSLSLLLTYIMMQSEHESILIAKEQMKTQQMRQDDLTGLLNRRAFTETIDRVSIGDSTVGVIFCDLNALKFTNDNFGHEAGDKLIVGFAKLLKNHFRRESAFRVSGDEFVIIMPTINKEKLMERMKLIADATSAYDVPTAAVGAAFGREEEINDLLKLAEKNMYQDKQDFYAKYPKFTR